MTRKCPPCTEEWMRWLDYRLPPLPIQLITIGGRLRDVQDAQESRFRQWRDTVRFQQDLIDRLCEEAGHVPAPLKKAVITLDVLV